MALTTHFDEEEEEDDKSQPRGVERTGVLTGLGSRSNGCGRVDDLGAEGRVEEGRLRRERTGGERRRRLTDLWVIFCLQCL